MTMLAVFRSRTQALSYLGALRKAGVPASAVSTPHEAGCGCGLSVRFGSSLFSRAGLVLAQRRYDAFAGFMREMGGSFRFVP